MATPTLIPTEELPRDRPAPQALTVADLLKNAPAIAKALGSGEPAKDGRVSLLLSVVAIIVAVGGIATHELVGNRGFSERISALEEGQADQRDALERILDLHQDHADWSEAALEALATKFEITLQARPDRRHVVRSIRQKLESK